MASRLPMSASSERDSAQSSTLLDHVQEYNIGYVGHDAAVVEGASAKAGDSVFDMAPWTLPGDRVTAFFNDWYFRIHFVPAALALGNLLSNQTRDVLVWNAYFVSKTVESFALSSGDGILVSEPQAAPYTMEPLGIYNYSISISTDGPPTINAGMVWSIDGAGYTVPITGRRVVVWAFKPNWNNPVDETLEWMTAIETAFDRTEHRSQQREEPRRVLEYLAQIVGNETALFESAMFGWADRLFALPLWQEKSTLTLDAEIDATTLSIDTDDRSYVPDGLLLLVKSASVYEAVEIESVADGSVALKKGLESAWPAGTAVFPVMVARIDGTANARYVAEDKLEVPMRFVGAPSETPTRIPDDAAALTFEGIEVYTEATNWISSLDVGFQPDVDMHDRLFGVFQTRPRSGWPTITKSHEWLCKSKAEGTALRGFFGRRKGRLTPVWMPSGTADFKLLDDVVLTDSVLHVVDNGYGSLVDGHPARKYVLIQLRGGTNLIREIDSVIPQEDGTVNLSLTVAAGVGFTVKQVRRISYLGRYRLAGDSVTFSHKTSGAAVVQAGFQLTRPGA